MSRTAEAMIVLPSKKIISWSSLLALLFGCSLAGWLIAAFQMHWLAGFVSLAIMAHLIVIGVDAIALANVWVILMMFMAAVLKAWPAVWDSRVPHHNAQLWASGLLLVWVGAAALVMLLAFAQPCVRSSGLIKSHLLRKTVILAWTASILGYLTYYLTL